MITTVKQSGSLYDDVGIDVNIITVTGQPETKMTMVKLADPEPIFDPDTGIIEDYEPGKAEVTIHIKGNKFPSNNEFSMVFHDFLHNNQLQWSPDVEQDMLWEVCRATEI